MWCAVIERALNDATERTGAVSDRAQRERLREEARLWFAANGSDFRLACEAAGLDPGFIRHHALRLIAAIGAVEHDRTAARQRDPADRGVRTMERA